MKTSAFRAACVAAAALASTSAAATERDRLAGGLEQHQAAFAGATLRLSFGGRSTAAPELRLGIGFSQHRRDAAGFVVSRGGPWLPLQAGMRNGRLELFVGGEPLAEIERRLGADGSGTRTAIIVGGVAIGAAAAILLLDGGGDDNNPCPPGVEVCVS